MQRLSKYPPLSTSSQSGNNSQNDNPAFCLESWCSTLSSLCVHLKLKHWILIRPPFLQILLFKIAFEALSNRVAHTLLQLKSKCKTRGLSSMSPVFDVRCIAYQFRRYRQLKMDRSRGSSSSYRGSGKYPPSYSSRNFESSRSSHGFSNSSTSYRGPKDYESYSSEHSIPIAFLNFETYLTAFLRYEKKI